MRSNGIPIIGAARKNAQTIAVLKDALDQAKRGMVTSVAMILIDAPGQFRVLGGGTDVDGLHAGCIELFKQLDKLVAAANEAKDAEAMKPKVVFDA